jgi:hypothetical protein
MLFTYDTEVALAGAAALVNTETTDDGDQLTTPAELDAFLREYAVSGVRLGTEKELAGVRRLRRRRRRAWLG